MLLVKGNNLIHQIFFKIEYPFPFIAKIEHIVLPLDIMHSLGQVLSASNKLVSIKKSVVANIRLATHTS